MMAFSDAQRRAYAAWLNAWFPDRQATADLHEEVAICRYYIRRAIRRVVNENTFPDWNA